MIIKQRFYETEGSGATPDGNQGTPAPQTKPAGTDIQNQTAERPKKTNISEFLNNQKVVSKPGTEPATKDSQDADKPKTKPIVQGPAATKEADKPAEAKPGEKPSGEAKSTPGKVKIGDFEMTEDEWLEAYQDRKNKANWQAAHTKKSQIINRFPDDVLNEIVPYVLSQRKLPDNVAEELRKISKLPEKIKVKDADGYEIEIDTKDIITDQFLNSVKQHVLVNAFPEYMKVVTEHEKLSHEVADLRTKADSQDLELGVSSSIKFMQENADFAVTVNEGENLVDVLAGIMTAGATHPEYENARRFGMLLKSIKDGFYTSFDEAYENLYGEKKRKQEIGDQVRKNQESGKPETPAGVPGQTPGQAMINRMKGGKADKLKTLNR